MNSILTLPDVLANVQAGQDWCKHDHNMASQLAVQAAEGKLDHRDLLGTADPENNTVKLH